MTKVLIIEDERKMASFIQQGLKEAGYEVQFTDTPSEARTILGKENTEVIILDVMLPEMSGIEFAKDLRAHGYKGLILMLTALSTTKDKISGLDSGADDYLTKPFDFEELLARLRALIRRKEDKNGELRNGLLVMNLLERQVHREGILIELTSKEFALLEFFMRNIDKVLDRNAIARKVWGSDFDPDSNVIDVYINHLRKKVDSPFTKKLLKTAVGQGYVLHTFEI